MDDLEVLDDLGDRDFELFEDLGDRDFVVLDDLGDRDFAVLEDFLPLFPLPSMAKSTVSSVSSSLARARRAGRRPNSAPDARWMVADATRRIDAKRNFIVAGIIREGAPLVLRPIEAALRVVAVNRTAGA